jgi:hypothetical protein
MPCTEMKELEASADRFAERRQVAIAPNPERRKGSDVPHRTEQARIAYLMLVHRRNCALCRSDD